MNVAALSAAAYAGMFVFGIVMALLGTVMPSLSSELSFTLAQAGNLFLVMNGCMLATSLLLGLLMDRYGMKPLLVFGPSLVAASLLLIARATAYSDLLTAVVLTGLGGGALNGATNTLVADLHDDEAKKASALNTLGVFFGIGALSLPFLSGALLTSFGLQNLLRIAAVLCGVAGIYALLLRFPRPKQAHRLPVREMSRFVGMPVVVALAFLLFFQSGNEFLLGGYFATFLTRDFQLSPSTAAYLLAAYWAAIILARIVLARLLLRLQPHNVVSISALIASAGCFLLAAAPSAAVAAIGIVIAGAALAGIFPTVLGVAGAQFRHHSGTVFGLLFTVALTGGMTMPWLSGRLAESAGLRYVFCLAAANFLCVAVLDAVAKRTTPVPES